MISKYLLSTCLFVIDDFNEQFKQIDAPSPKLIHIAYAYTEADLVVRIGYPFRQMAKFVMQTSKGKNAIAPGNDIVVDAKDFRIEVKYLKTQRSAYETDSGKSQIWQDIRDDFDWLMRAVEQGGKDKRAFVIGWFNSTQSFSNLMPLGMSDRKATKRKGVRQIDFAKFVFFPFLDFDKSNPFTNTITYRYECSYTPLQVPLIPGFRDRLNCLFLGTATDKFHMAIYY